MTIQVAYQQLLVQLYEVYDTREAANIADMVIEHVTGQRKIERIVYKDIPVNQSQQEQLYEIAAALQDHKPIQYVLGYTWFMNMKLLVKEHVLIPRPETEELVAWIIEDIHKLENKEISLLDIGTGSGCIPIAIRKKIPEVAVSAIDISRDALSLATLNSIEQKVLVDFLYTNFLDEAECNHLGRYNTIVSNPPYIKRSEESSMRENVLKYEPKVALFVPDEDALVFYKAIAKFSNQHLKENGTVYVEINEALGEEVVKLFKNYGFAEVTLRKDMQGKDRMVKATGLMQQK
jgi:release factor glutamine methyltransferase